MSDTSIPPPVPPVKMAEIEGKGRALVTTQPLRAGQIVLRDSPILLYSAAPLLNHDNKYCSHCFRTILSPVVMVSCPWCSSASLFCNPECRSVALSSSHTQWVCQALSRLREANSPLLHRQQDCQVQARFLVAAYNLAVVSPLNFQTLLSLQGDSISSQDDATLFLHSVISSICPPPNHSQFGFSASLSAVLLAKDKLNAFGLMEPFAQHKERSVRAYGVYPRASFFNHDCLPNACRFDYVDSVADHGNTDIIVRVIHDLPEGREICLSYFPVNLKYSERQRRLKEDYGFACDCDRCKVEANWSDEEEGEGEGEEEEEEEAPMDEDSDEDMAHDSETEDCGLAKEDNGFPHAYFFLQYMCNRDNCWGTLAPLPPADSVPSTVMECNVCGNLSNSEQPMDGNEQFH